MLSMAGILEQLFRPQKRAVMHCATRMSPKAMELEAAREILAEVFGVRLSEVDEMIWSRFEAEDKGPEKKEVLWPQEFWL